MTDFSRTAAPESTTLRRSAAGQHRVVEIVRELAMLAVGLPVTILGFVVACVAVAIGIVAIVTVVLAPLALPAFMVVRTSASVRRTILSAVVGRHLTAVPRSERAARGPYRAVIARLRSGRTGVTLLHT